MLALAFGIGIGVEFVRVEGDIGRMNTVFKYYLVAWLLFAGAGGYGLWRGWTAAGKGALRWTLAGLVGIITAGALAYPALAIPVRISDNDVSFAAAPLTLDGAAWMADAVHWERDQAIALRGDAAAIRWLQDNAARRPGNPRGARRPVPLERAHLVIHRPAHRAGLALASDAAARQPRTDPRPR